MQYIINFLYKNLIKLQHFHYQQQTQASIGFDFVLDRLHKNVMDLKCLTIFLLHSVSMNFRLIRFGRRSVTKQLLMDLKSKYYTVYITPLLSRNENVHGNWIEL